MRSKQDIVGIVVAAFLAVTFVVVYIVLPLSNRRLEDLFQRKEKPKTAKQGIPPQTLQVTNAPLRRPPENVQRRALPTNTVAQASTQAVVRVPPQGTGNLNQQWTKPLAMPVKNPEPPNPSQTPPIKVDPARHPTPDVPRHSIE